MQSPTATPDAQTRRSQAAARRRSERRRISEEGLGVWTRVEHDRFLEAKRLYPNGPWKLVAEFVGTRNTRQTMTHAQKYRQKLERRRRGLRTTRKVSEFEHVLSPDLYLPSSLLSSHAHASPISPPSTSLSPASVLRDEPPKSVNTVNKLGETEIIVDTVDKLGEIDIVVDDPATASLLPPPPSLGFLAGDDFPLSSPSSVKLGGFEQLLLMDDALCLDPSSSPATLERFVLLASIMDKSAPPAPSETNSGSSPTHHADAELPWLDECLDYLIDNLR